MLRSRLKILKLFPGQSGHLTVSLKPNTPSVQCSPSVKPPIGDVCQQVLDYLPASKMKQVFGSRDTAGIDVPIPYTLADRTFLQ